MEILRALAAAVPALCVACGRGCRAGSALCPSCGSRLDRALPLQGPGPPGFDRAWSSAPYEGVARELVAALKFRRLLPVAELMAARIARLAPASARGGALVPVPPSPQRLRRRGYDPAGELAAALAERFGAELAPCLARRGGRRQVGRGRGQRVARPPQVRVAGPVPPSAIVVDDVLTTGATLGACAGALRRAGATRLVAVTFARRL
ncbi:MAG: ComF family protein [Syntrophothermus sp.]